MHSLRNNELKSEFMLYWLMLLRVSVLGEQIMRLEGEIAGRNEAYLHDLVIWS